MSTIQEMFQQAQLAEAAYANLAGITSSTDPLTLQSRLINLQPNGSYDFSAAQAAAFVADWSVVSQQSDTGSFSTTRKVKGVSIAFEKFGKTELHSPNCILRT